MQTRDNAATRPPQQVPTASIGREASAVVGAVSRSTRLRKPMIIAQVKNQLGTLIGGGTVEFFDASTGYRLTVMDDDANDQWNNAVGYILHAFNAPGTHGVCETATPKDTFLTSQKCFKMQLGWNQMYWPIFTNQQKL